MSSLSPIRTPVAACEAVPTCDCSTCYLAYDCQRQRYGRSVAWPALVLAAIGLFAVLGAVVA